MLGGGAVETALAGRWQSKYDAWRADKELTAEERASGKATYSDNWLADRGELMRYWLKAHTDNTTTASGEDKISTVAVNGLPATDKWRYIDFAEKETLNVSSSIGAYDPTASSPKILHVVGFGDD